MNKNVWAEEAMPILSLGDDFTFYTVCEYRPVSL
jgi:hypothetical protein